MDNSWYKYAKDMRYDDVNSYLSGAEDFQNRVIEELKKVLDNCNWTDEHKVRDILTIVKNLKPE